MLFRSLLTSPRVAGAAGARGRARLADFVVQNVARYVAGEPVTHVISL